MATQQLVWFANGTEKYFTTQAAAEAYEKQVEVQRIIAGTGMNTEAAKKAAKAVIAHFNVSDKEAVMLANPASVELTIEEPGTGALGE